MTHVRHTDFPHIEAHIDGKARWATNRCGRCGTTATASFTDVVIYGEHKEFVEKHKDCPAPVSPVYDLADS